MMRRLIGIFIAARTQPASSMQNLSVRLPRSRKLLSAGQAVPTYPPILAAEVSFPGDLPGTGWRRPSDRGRRPHQPETGILAKSESERKPTRRALPKRMNLPSLRKERARMGQPRLVRGEGLGQPPPGGIVTEEAKSLGREALPYAAAEVVLLPPSLSMRLALRLWRSPPKPLTARPSHSDGVWGSKCRS